ncbi:cytidyltransferase [bacterium]|nr:cytidyltransferase [bacterium]
MTERSPNVFVSLYADPIHSGHIEYIHLAKELADARGGKLIVCVNNDAQAALKKGRPFMKCAERVLILQALRDVDIVFASIDTDRSVCASLRLAHAQWGVGAVGQGGDRNSGEAPETAVCVELGIEMVDGMGDKIQSSSALTGLKAI